MSYPSLLPRKGRDKQRYEDIFRLVSGCIPYRLAKDSEEDHRIQVCMVSSPDRDDLVFPKGGWEDDETIHEAAHREAMEEAGVRGILNENPLGVWEFRSKSNQDSCTSEGGCRGYMFALEVTEELDSWPEQAKRYRKWLNIKEASRLCRYEWTRMALKKFLEAMIEGEKLESGLKLSEDEEKVVVVEEVVELPSITVSDVAECKIVTPNCYEKPSSAGSSHQHIGTFSWIFPLKRLSLA